MCLPVGTILPPRSEAVRGAVGSTFSRARRAASRAAIDQAWDAARPPQDLIYGDGSAGSQIAEVIARAPLSIEKMLTL